MDEPIAPAAAERLSALETPDFFEERTRRADVEAAILTMSRVRGESPRAGDELSKGVRAAQLHDCGLNKQPPEFRAPEIPQEEMVASNFEGRTIKPGNYD